MRSSCQRTEHRDRCDTTRQFPSGRHGETKLTQRPLRSSTHRLALKCQLDSGSQTQTAEMGRQYKKLNTVQLNTYVEIRISKAQVQGAALADGHWPNIRPLLGVS